MKAERIKRNKLEGFADFLRRSRTAARMSASTLATLCGYSRFWIYKLEQGQIPTRKMVVQICDRLGLEPVVRDTWLIYYGYLPRWAALRIREHRLEHRMLRLLTDATYLSPPELEEITAVVSEAAMPRKREEREAKKEAKIKESAPLTPMD